MKTNDPDWGGRRPRSHRKKKKLAQSADRHRLYELSVQDAAVDAETLGRLYKRFRKKEALVFKEDFCGTGLLSATWASRKKNRRAIGVDLDAETLQWGRTHNVLPLGPDVARRIKLIEANVLDGKGGKADLTCALNFSYQCFKQRSELLRYFKVVRRGLAPDGLFILDAFGGSDVMGEDENEHEMDGFTYRWEQESFDPLTHRLVCHIHFEFPDGSEISPAFTYDWRLWTPPELCDVLEEAGFSKVRRLWEKTDDDNEGTGVFYEPKEVENQESWWTYLVAER